MRKIYVLLIIGLFVSCYFSFGQTRSQRLVLAEEFTQASCGPCASANPTFNALLDANSTKIISIKYQTDWPGVDPMNDQNPAQVATRVTYYSVSGVPDARIDGDTLLTMGSSYTGYPNNFTQAKLNQEYAVPAPFTINLTHTISADFDSIYIDVTVTASASVSGTLKLHTAIIERHIHFATAPGSNGETDFYNVMRKMLPSDQGQALQASFTNGQSQTFHYGVPLPTYIYNMNEVAVVAFVQDNANKHVHQAAYSAPIPMALDAAITSVSGIPTMQCTNTINPTCVLTNTGATNLTGATIEYKVDNNAPSTYSWTGNLALNATANITLPPVTTTAGSHTFTVTVVLINGAADNNTGNNAMTKSFSIAGAATPVPLTEMFSTTPFPPTSWVLDNPDAGSTWTRVTNANAPGGGTPSASAKMDFYNSSAGNIDNLTIKPLDFSSFVSASMTFYVAYAQYQTENDRLEVQVSTNCGTTWVSKYNKAGTSLSTAPAYSAGPFIPSSTQWRLETVDLSTLAGQANVFIKFRATSAYGNNCYVDLINISGVVGIENQNSVSQELVIYPNPTDGKVTVLNAENSEISVFNILGQNILKINKAGVQNTIDLTGLTQGNYFIKVTNGNSVTTKKVVLTK